MSDDLRQFFIDYLQWYESGAEDSHPYFAEEFGLCSSLVSWSGVNEELKEELKILFEQEGLDAEYPFNKGSKDYIANYNKTLNPARIAFVRKHAA